MEGDVGRQDRRVLRDRHGRRLPPAEEDILSRTAPDAHARPRRLRRLREPRRGHGLEPLRRAVPGAATRRVPPAHRAERWRGASVPPRQRPARPRRRPDDAPHRAPAVRPRGHAAPGERQDRPQPEVARRRLGSDRGHARRLDDGPAPRSLADRSPRRSRHDERSGWHPRRRDDLRARCPHARRRSSRALGRRGPPRRARLRHRSPAGRRRLPREPPRSGAGPPAIHGHRHPRPHHGGHRSGAP